MNETSFCLETDIAERIGALADHHRIPWHEMMARIVRTGVLAEEKALQQGDQQPRNEEP